MEVGGCLEGRSSNRDIDLSDGESGSEHGRPAMGIELRTATEHRQVSGGRESQQTETCLFYISDAKHPSPHMALEDPASTPPHTICLLFPVSSSSPDPNLAVDGWKAPQKRRLLQCYITKVTHLFSIEFVWNYADPAGC